MSMRSLLLPLIAIACGVTTSDASEIFQVGDQRITADFIEPYSAEFEFFTTASDGSKIIEGRWKDNVDFVEKDGLRILRRHVTRYSTAGASDLDRVMLADPTTMRPISTHQTFGSNLTSVYHVDFHGVAITQIILALPDAPANVIQKDLEAPLFDPAFWATLANALPFEPGLKATLPIYQAGAAVASEETFHIVGAEKVAALGKEFQAWRIEATNADWTFWLRKSPPYIVRIDHPLPDGRRATSVPLKFEQ